MTEVNIASNLDILRKNIARACLKAGRSPDEVTLIAVTKTVGTTAVEEAFNLGIRHFGENRVQEAERKIRGLSHLQPRPAWHMIGHLQSNKVKAALDLFDIIQSVDSLDKANLINRRVQRKIPVLLQVNVSGEKTKGGFLPEEMKGVVAAVSLLPNLEIKGLMTIAPAVEDAEEVRGVFRKMRELRDLFGLEHLSMGMTEDFEVAIEEGATMIRIGRAIFGERG
ncbi:MAG: YggS family pyridoxal phosphate-dependent enzyme [Dehalococcoidales bacterium]|nr:YggS family pyridoxal phosphate-dependent enzyme [Dehalococcoidales bacterium]